MDEKSSSQKAQVRHLFKQIFPDVFFKGFPKKTPGIVGEDAIMSVRCIGDRELLVEDGKEEPQVPDARTYAKCLKRTAEWNLKYKGCEYYLMCLDCDDLVPVTKGQEQEKRDSSRSERELQREHEMEERGLTPTRKKKPPYFDLDDPIPLDFETAMKDRKVFRPWLLGWIARQLIESEDPRLRVDVPFGKTLLISGHRLSREDAEDLEIEVGKMTDKEILCTPISIVGPSPGDMPEVSFAKWARNEIGEGEFQIFTLHRAVCEKKGIPMTLDCISTDSDFINLSLIYFEKFPFAPQITWRYAPRQGWIFYREMGNVRKKKIFSPSLSFSNFFFPPPPLRIPTQRNELTSKS
jgi:hypothetical protein